MYQIIDNVENEVVKGLTFPSRSEAIEVYGNKVIEEFWFADDVDDEETPTPIEALEMYNFSVVKVGDI